MQVADLSEGSVWTFRHPTIRDALSEIVASDQELIDVYLLGTPTKTLLEEVTCIGITVRGARVVLPKSKYSALISILKDLDPNAIAAFLTDRADEAFLSEFINARPKFAKELLVRMRHSPTLAAPLLARLFEHDLLNDGLRSEYALLVEEYCVTQPAADFIDNEDVSRLLTAMESQRIRERIQAEVIPELDSIVDGWEGGYDSGDDPEQFFESLTGTLDRFASSFADDEEAVEQINFAQRRISEVVERLMDEDSTRHEDQYVDDDYYMRAGGRDDGPDFERDPFEDVDR